MDEFKRVVFDEMPAWLAGPGIWAVERFGYSAYDTGPFVVALVLSFFLWSWVLRTLYCVIGRPLGLYNPAHFHLFPRLPYRYVLKLYLMFRRWLRNWRYGKAQTGGWAGLLDQLLMLFKPGMIYVGRIRAFNLGGFMPIGIKAKRHLVMVAASGGGKTTTIASMLSTHRGNAFVIDPNGQLARGMRHRCGSGGPGVIGKGHGRRVCVLDPKQQIEDVISACWNPFDELHAVAEREGEDAVPDVVAKMCKALIEQDSQMQPFFANASRQFAYAVILFMFQREPRERQTMMRFRELYSQGLEGSPDDPDTPSLTYLLFEMEQCEKFGNTIRNAIKAVKTAVQRQGEGPLLSAAMTQTDWIDLPQMTAIMGRSNFTLDELKTGNLTLFVCAPLTDVRVTLKAWFRLLASMAQDTFERIPGRPTNPTLFAIDELPSLGPIEAFDTIPATGRKYGIQLLAITQDLEKLQGVYPDSWEGFLSNADAVLWMSCDHQPSLKYLEEKLGSTTRYERAQKGEKKYRVERQVAYAEQLGEFLYEGTGNMILKPSGRRAVKLKTPHHFKELPVYHYQRDPSEKERLLRRMGRMLCNTFIWGPPNQRLGHAFNPNTRPTAEQIARKEQHEADRRVKSFGFYVDNLVYEVARHNGRVIEAAAKCGIVWQKPSEVFKQQVAAAGLNPEMWTKPPAEDYHDQQVARLREIKDRVVAEAERDTKMFFDANIRFRYTEEELRKRLEERGAEKDAYHELVAKLAAVKEEVESIIRAGNWPHGDRDGQAKIIDQRLGFHSVIDSYAGIIAKHQAHLEKRREQDQRNQKWAESIGLHSWPTYAEIIDREFDPEVMIEMPVADRNKYYRRFAEEDEFLKMAYSVHRLEVDACFQFLKDVKVLAKEQATQKIHQPKLNQLIAGCESAARQHLADRNLTAYESTVYKLIDELMAQSPVVQALKVFGIEREGLSGDRLEQEMNRIKGEHDGEADKGVAEAYATLQRYIMIEGGIAA